MKPVLNSAYHITKVEFKSTEHITENKGDINSIVNIMNANKN